MANAKGYFGKKRMTALAKTKKTSTTQGQQKKKK
jgi:hypothetical protein